MRVNSARVAGGAAPDPEHWTVPVPQSPVAHEKFPAGPVEQSVLAHTLPDHDGGTVMAVVLPGRRVKPVAVAGSWAVPAPERVAGHTV